MDGKHFFDGLNSMVGYICIQTGNIQGTLEKILKFTQPI